jgi:glycosyltransferase involved in cell wall biosynthesis/putative flippase GtrA
MVTYVQRFFGLHIIRYALVGGIGIPVNLMALAVFLHLFGDTLYPLASACAFEISTTVNFVINQLFTYSDQERPYGLNWVRRALKAQLTSLSALLVTFVIALLFKYGLHVGPYLANTIGIVCAFFYNFIVSKRYVFRPVESERSEQVTQLADSRLTSHSLSNATSGYIQNGQVRKQDMQSSEIPERAIEPESLAPICSFLSSEVTLSIVVPVMNERQNIRPLFEKISTKLNQLGKRYEVIFVDDGSTDHTFIELQKLHLEHPDIVSVIRFRRNFGKTPALVAGFSRCRGDVVFTMDGDQQDDPEEIHNFLAKLDEGYDLVTGLKFPRLDPLTKTFPSRIFNGLVSRLTGLHLHDINCGFKAYRREVIEDIHLKLYGEFHRFIPVMAHWRGFRVAEIKVRHHPRTFGVSKFGTRRFARGLIDLLTVLFLTSSVHTPLRLFGKLGVWTLLMGTLVDIFVVVRSFITGIPIHNQPLLFVGILLMIFGFQFFLIGLLGEMIRYFAFQPNEEYSVRQELALRSDAHANVPFVPAEVPMQKVPPQAWEQPLYPLSPQNWEQQLQPQLNGHNGHKHDTRNRNIPHRPTMIPL